VTRLLSFLLLAAALGFVAVSSFSPTQAADPPESPRVKAVREKVLTHKLTVDIDKKMLEPLLKELQELVKEATNIEVKIEKVPGTAGVTFTSSFGPLKGEMTLEEILNKICDDRNWGWFVNVDKPGDQKDGRIYLSTNSKERGHREGAGKEVAKKDPPKGKEKTKEEPKANGGDGDKEAAELLTKAKLQINLKQPEKAKATLNEIIEKHADSKQAADAKKLLEKLEK